MKKLFYSLFILATTAMTFSSCEDVPAPFDFPNPGGDTPAPTIDPVGSGTQADPYNVAAAIAYTQQLEPGTESPSTIYIKGKISSIREEYTTQYGNGTFYISDDGSGQNTFLVYRALYLGNKKFTASDTQIQEGDEVIICGIVTNYNGTLETQQNKAYLYSLNGKTAGGGGTTPSGDAKGSGTVDDPWNPVGANNYVSSLGADQESDKDYYIKGKISKIASNGEFNSNYGNASFYISEDGTEGNDFYVFRTLYLGNKKWTDGDTQIKVGDEVVICGKLVNYRGNTPETVQNKSYIYSLNGKSEGGGGGDTPGGNGEAKGSGTQSDPWNAVAANNFAKALSADAPTSESYYIKGKIAKIANNGTFNAQYGNASFYISDDGKDENTFYVFRTLYLGNNKWVDGNTQIKVGDEVVIYGKLVNYRGNTPETQQNESYIYSLNGKTSDDGSGGGGGGEQTGAGSYDAPYSVAAAVAAGSGSGVYVKAYIVGYVEGQVLAEGAHFTADGCNVKTNLLIADSSSETNVANCIPVQLPSGNVRTGLNLQDNPGNLGKQVLLYGNIEKYFGTTGVKSVTYAEIGGSGIGSKP
jgi:molybdopterin converting factor small subunit